MNLGSEYLYTSAQATQLPGDTLLFTAAVLSAPAPASIAPTVSDEAQKWGSGAPCYGMKLSNVFVILLLPSISPLGFKKRSCPISL